MIVVGYTSTCTTLLNGRAEFNADGKAKALILHVF